MPEFAYSRDQLIEIVNNAKQQLASALLKEGLISKELHRDIVENLAITLRAKDSFGTLWDKVWGSPEKEGSYQWEILRKIQIYDRVDGKQPGDAPKKVDPEEKKEENRFDKISNE
jgi:hypothetical protein